MAKISGKSLFQYDDSKDDPTLNQVKLTVAALDLLGLPRL